LGYFGLFGAWTGQNWSKGPILRVNVVHIGPNLLRTGPGLSRMAQNSPKYPIFGVFGAWAMDLGLGQVLDQAWTMAGPGPWLGPWLGQYMYMAGHQPCTWLATNHVHGWWTNGWWTVGPPLVHICVSIGPGKPFDLRERVFGPLNLPGSVDPVDELRPFKANALAIFVTFYAIFVRSV